MDLRLVEESEVANSTIYAKRSLGLQNLVTRVVSAMPCKIFVGTVLTTRMKTAQAAQTY